jgi:hypothetical protein
LVDKGAIMAGLVGAGEDVGAYGMSEEESEAILLRALGRVRERREVLEVDAEVVDGE